MFSSAPQPVIDDTSPSERHPLFPFFFLIPGLVLIAFAAIQVLKYHEISKGIALFGSGAVALLCAAILFFPSRARAFATRDWIKRCTIGVAVLWGGWAALIAYVHRIDGWDEGAYFLSGLALRGYDVPYASHRPPITGLICAVFVGWDRFLNPILAGALLVAVYLWVRRLLGPLYAMLALFVLLCQNLLLDSTVDIMSELPAAIILFAGFFALAEERFWWSALWFALLGFARWNLEPVSLVVLAAVFMRFGIRQALKFLGLSVVAFCAWYGFTVAMGTPHPILRVIQGNLLAGPAFRPEQTNHFRILLKFYGSHFFFLTPPVLLALVANPILNWRKRLPTQLWVPLLVMPLALLSYLGAMLIFGGPFSRFMTPVIPAAVVSMMVGLSKFCEDHRLPNQIRMRIVTAALFLVCSMGLWPLDAIVHARVNHNTPGIFSAELRKKLLALDRTQPLYGVPRAPLCRNNGYPAMAEVRHTILFPTAARDGFTHNYIEEPDSVEGARKLAAACRSGDLMLIPKKFASGFQVVFADEQWALIRNP